MKWTIKGPIICLWCGHTISQHGAVYPEGNSAIFQCLCRGKTIYHKDVETAQKFNEEEYANQTPDAKEEE